ncbi:hypothetical protein GW17_00011198, partial [Ensete ventricosum]
MPSSSPLLFSRPHTTTTMLRQLSLPRTTCMHARRPFPLHCHRIHHRLPSTPLLGLKSRTCTKTRECGVWELLG